MITEAVFTQGIGIIIAVIVSAVVPLAFVFLAEVLGPKNITKVKEEPFECGSEPVGSPWVKFPVKYFIPAILFLIFDLEVVAFYPWAVMFRKFSYFGITLMMAFFSVLIVGFIYAWKKGGFDWD